MSLEGFLLEGKEDFEQALVPRSRPCQICCSGHEHHCEEKLWATSLFVSWSDSWSLLGTLPFHSVGSTQPSLPGDWSDCGLFSVLSKRMLLEYVGRRPWVDLPGSLSKSVSFSEKKVDEDSKEVEAGRQPTQGPLQADLSGLSIAFLQRPTLPAPCHLSS